MFKNLLNLFFPKSCAGCTSFLLKNEVVICTTCRHEIPLTNHHKTKNNDAIGKFYGRIPLEFASALFYFHKKGIVQELIHKLKYKGHQEIGNAIGFWYAEELKSVAEIDEVDFIIPVPLHKKRFKERGYNQVTEFGKALSDGLKIEYNEAILERSIYSDTQVRKNINQRSDVTESVFKINSHEKLHNKHFLLIDDVITTGATLESCGREILKIPGAKLSIVCMAMTQ
ncbi:ComF family protein [Flavobacterium sp.]|uniref:ComF family protein n=1 Tax=Flavobacterium sp. TaxID=239 RepID=UPI00375056D3